ncbi:hypothetical protein K432DRAFT_455910 [Lepidopterella palustris CBS 459.81]|uniref:Fungal N-terminal domain-containing protein n=1 Tax=Lepidopterella palustris CBS 459.81 TaxID=1314670 RepID=A0A8E2JEP5_9PEZI|nr:hypothetical protein K432DRAFT_455910 [Lepidopterella palustris CBS 459.81]
MIPVSLADITKAASFAWQIYQLGFSSENSATDRQYAELGEDIQDLAKNLDSICDVVKNAGDTWREHRQRRRPAPQKEWDLSSIQEIVGDYQATLADCKRLLDENAEFRAKRGPVRNVEWNLVYRPKAERLQKRLNAHKSKILLLLKPLELTLLSDVRRDLVDIHGDLASRIDEVHTSLMNLQGLLIPDVAEAIIENDLCKDIPLQVPEHIDKKFLEAAARSRPAVRDPGRFPLQLGADSFLEHFQNSTKTFKAGRFLVDRTPEPEKYLNLLKCIWILKRIQSSTSFTEIRETSTDSQWPGYINQLHEDLYDECQRFSAPSTQKLLPPNMEVSFKDSQYEIWVEEDITSFFSPHTQKVHPPVLRVPLSKKSETLTRELAVHPVSHTMYRLIETIKDLTAPDRSIPPLEVDVDVEKFSFLPLYATPSSSQKALEVVLGSGSNEITPEFQELKHIYRLQHLLTGYKVYERYDQAMVVVTCVISSQSETIQEYGRIQLWLPEPFNRVTPNASTTSIQQSSLGSPIHISRNENSRNPSRTATTIDQRAPPTLLGLRSNPNNLAVPGAAGRSFSLVNSTILSRKPVPASLLSTSSSPLATPKSRTSPTSSDRASIMTTSTAATTASQSTVATFTTINTGASSRARLHAKPLKPLLVIFLKSKDQSSRLSIVAIEMDGLTNVVRERCECRSSKSRCRVSCVERENGSLLVQRWDAGDNLTSWDIAKLSTAQRRDTDARWEKLKRVSLKFERWEDRYRFSGAPCKCSVATTHELSNCNLLNHNGLFGIVKQIGTQRLLNYHDQRDKRSVIITGRLPDDDTF